MNLSSKDKLKSDDSRIMPRYMEENWQFVNNLNDPKRLEGGQNSYYFDFSGRAKEFSHQNVLHSDIYVDNNKLIIGKYCSIAQGVKFLMNGANHALGSLSNFPFQMFEEFCDDGNVDLTKVWDVKGNTIVGNDVWIGHEAVIMAGVTIGNGAVIGARAVVTKNVEGYTIVGGVPAKFIRKRFDDDTIDKLQKIQWWNWNIAKIKNNLEHFYSGNINALVQASLEN